MSYKIAVVGATGNVGREILTSLSERNFPISQAHALAGDKTVGQEVSFGEEAVLKVEALSDFDFKGIDFVFNAAGSATSAGFAERAAKQGAVVIDLSSLFRLEKDIPLVVPEVNPEALKEYSKRNIISCPSPAAVQLAVALKPLHDLAGLKRVVVSTYQSVSSAGKQAMDELFNQTRALYSAGTPPREVFSRQISFNLIPQIDVFREDGSTREEWKLCVETKKILGQDIDISATCVRVPVFVSDSESVNVEFNQALSAEKARRALQKAPGVVVIDNLEEEDSSFITPAETTGEDSVFVSRVRQDSSVAHGLNLWVVADNLRKGSATNAVQIAELLVRDYL